MIRIAVIGAAGRMGQRILSLAGKNTDTFTIAGAVEYPSHPMIGKNISEFTDVKNSNIVLTPSTANCINNCDVVIDFSNPESTMDNAVQCRNSKKALVIGTTGLTGDQINSIKTYSSDIAMVVAPNMSVGVNLLFALVKKAAAILDEDYDIEITEAHHRFKKDAPSGTAKKLAEMAALGRGVNLADKAVYGREGITGERKKGDIGMHALRMGNVTGDHTVCFANLAERIEFTHKAESRDVFAIGALRAAVFVSSAKPGWYDMMDVLNLKF